jgi:hypothetical protein
MNHEFWYLSRAAGFTAYALLALSVAGGLALSVRMRPPRVAARQWFEAHRSISFLALALTLLHVAALLGDGYFDFGPADVLLPFASPYRPWETALGVIALYALVAVCVSFYLKRWIGQRGWRALHFASFALFALATLHGVTAGSDTHEMWARALYAVAGGAVLALVLYRVQLMPGDPSPARALRVSSSVAAAVIAAVVLGRGALLPGGGTSQASLASVSSPPARVAAALYDDDREDHDEREEHEDEGERDHDDDDDDDHEERHHHDEEEEDDD